MEDFYSTIPIFDNLNSIDNLSEFKDIPKDWLIAVCSIEVKELSEKTFKSYNTISVASISAVINAVKDEKVPFVFGGASAMIAYPHRYSGDVKATLAGVRDLAKGVFKLKANMGIIPVADIYADDRKLKAARIKFAGNTTQAIFVGGGIQYAAELLENNPGKYEISESNPIDPDFSGFECRWNEIPAKSAEIITIIIQAQDILDLNDVGPIYSKILNKISELYGSSADRSPISVEDLSLTLNANLLKHESKLKVNSGTPEKPSIGKLMVNNLAVKALDSVGRKVDGVDFDKYKNDVASNLGNEKFHDQLRLVISGEEQDRIKLVSFLEELKASGDIFYGLHVSKAVNMTCLIFDRSDDHIHFIDGNDGGYFKAEKALKEQMGFLNIIV